MRVVLRVLAWIWIVVTSLGGVGSVLLTLGEGEPVKALIMLVIGVILVLPGVLVLSLTRPKAPQGQGG